MLPKGGLRAPAQRVALLAFDSAARGVDHMIELRHLLEEAGHVSVFPGKTLLDLGMDARRVSRFARRTRADAWVVQAGSREVLEWFAQQETPAFALFGRRGGLPIAGTGPDKAPVFREVTRRLITLGHHRISVLCRHPLRLPRPGRVVRAFLDELETNGIRTGNFNAPDWEESRRGFGDVIDSLFERTPPTALILDESTLFHAACHHLAAWGLRAPEDVSLVCAGADPGFAWCRTAVTHIRWDYRPVVRRAVRWANNVAHGKDDRRQTLTRAELVEGGTVGPAPKEH